jgi:hypothetical protein
MVIITLPLSTPVSQTMWTSMPYIDGKFDLVIPQMFLPMQVSPISLTQHRLEVTQSYSKVADVSVMLALMAGRNAGSGVTLVKEGKVC